MFSYLLAALFNSALLNDFDVPQALCEISQIQGSHTPDHWGPHHPPGETAV